jgi:organic hydroperoxide reductase OsmC/OhrA
VTATITAAKGPAGIVIQASHLEATVTALSGLDEDALQAVARAVEDGCTISVALKGNVAITSNLTAARA